MNVRLPDGTVIENVPDGTTKADLVTKLKTNGMAVPAEWMQDAPAHQPAEKSAAERIGAGLRDIPRQVGMFARYGMEGLGGLADVAANPIRQIVVNPALRGLGLPQASSVGDGASSLADAIGLPSPRTADERVVGDATRTLASAGGMAGGAAKLAAKYAPGMVQNVLQTLAARPAMQSVGAATAGAAGGSVRESGGSPGEQFAASLVGGVAGGVAAAKAGDMATSGGNAIRNLLTPKTTQIQQADQAITLIFERQGMDWSQVPERIKQGMRAEVAQAMEAGQPLNGDALRRLLVMRRAGVTPTVGQLTQDPGQITREANLAKTGANSTDPSLQRLPALQNTNTKQLLNQLDEAGATSAQTAPDTARAAIKAMDATVSRTTKTIDDAYAAARDSQGRSVVLDGRSASQGAVQKLAKDGVGKLPPEVDGWLNDITTGKTPLTVDYQQQLAKNLFRKIKGTQDGDLKHGLGIVRQSILDAEPIPSNVNPGNLPAVYGTVPPSQMQAGQEAIEAYKAARTAHRNWIKKVEGNPALNAVVDGVEPDQFVQKFVIGKGASAADVQALRSELTPQATEEMRTFLVRHLKDAATNSTEDVTKFSGDAYRKALGNLGEKLGTFFTKEEIQHLRDLGDAAKYMQAQPAGAAVNNSNSGALVLGRALDVLERIAQKSPIGREAITGILQGKQQAQVMQPKNALIGLAEKQPTTATNPLLAAAIASPPSEKKRRN